VDRRASRPAFFAYSANYLIDADNAIIVEVDDDRDPPGEILAAKRMIERSLEHFDLYPERLIGDTGLRLCRDAELLVHDRGSSRTSQCSTNPAHDGTFSREDFTLRPRQ